MKILHETLLKYSNELSQYFSDADTIYCMLIFAAMSAFLSVVLCLAGLCTFIFTRKNKNIIGSDI
jgi:hypothetical protein